MTGEPTTYTLTVVCQACNREPGTLACVTCSRLEDAEHTATGRRSPELATPADREPRAAGVRRDG